MSANPYVWPPPFVPPPWTSSMYDGVGFDHRVGHFRPPGLVDELPNPRVLQGLRCFYLGRRLLGWPPPCSRPWGGWTVCKPKLGLWQGHTLCWHASFGFFDHT